MTADQASDLLVDQILADDNREIRLLVARGMFPLPPGDLVALQVEFSASDDLELAEAARDSLGSLDPKIAGDVIAESDSLKVLVYFAENHEHPVVKEALMRHREVTAEILGGLAPKLSEELQELLLLRQDLIVESPEILTRLAENESLSTYSVRRIGEYRDHLVREEVVEEETEPVEVDPEFLADQLTEDEVEKFLREALATPPDGEKDEVTGLSEAQVRTLPVPVRLKLTRGAPRTLRSILVRDKNPMVAISVLHGNAMTDSEVEQIAANRGVLEDVMAAISRNRQWSRKYNVVHQLVRNPRTPVGIAVRMVSRLSIRDLRNLSRDRNVSEAVRTAATRLYRIKIS